MCWERLLPQSRKSSIKATAIGADIERFSKAPAAPGPKKEATKTQFVEKLKSLGLESWEVTLMVQRFYDNRTFEEIAKDGNWTSVQAAAYVYRRTLAKLRKRGWE